MAERRFFSGPTLERAVLEGASHYDIEPSELAYKRVEKRGTLSSKKNQVVIRVNPAAPRIEVVAEPEPVEVPVEVREEPASEVEAEVAAAEFEPADSPGDEAAGETFESEVSDFSETAEAGGDAEEPQAAAEEAEATDDGAEQPLLSEALDAEARPESEFGEPAVAEEQAPEESMDAEEAQDEEAAQEQIVVRQLIELPASPAEVRAQRAEAEGSAADSARRWVGALLGLGEIDASATVFDSDEGLEICLTGADGEILMEDGGQLLRSIQHLMPRLIQSDVGSLVECQVDCDDFQVLREEQLRVEAIRAADRVRRDGRTVKLEPMHPADRRVVHLALVDDPAVETESLGRGYFKRVMVRQA